ncbi:MAG: hypothetical protein ACR2HG_15940 [Pyrinomonadaceae bacterium]
MNLQETDLNAPLAAEYEFTGTTQTRFQTLFTENETSHLVENSITEDGKAIVKVKDFTQTSDALIDVLGADLSRVIDILKFQIGERETLEKILNMDEVWESWQAAKARLIEKYKDIPDFGSISDSFGDNLKNEEKLRLNIENKGIYGLLFPQVKFTSYGRIPNEVFRTKVIREGILSKDLPMAEMVKIRRGADDELLIEVKGELDKDKFDYAGFLNTARQMFGGHLKNDDIVFHGTENYTLDARTLDYTNGTRQHRFEIKGSYFRDERQTFKLKAD